MNVAAFRWGRRAAHEPEAVQALVDAGRPGRSRRRRDAGRDRRAARRVPHRLPERGLCASAIAERIDACARAPRSSAVPGSTALTEAAARNLFKLMAIKDEYEVARLYTDGSFAKQLAPQFAGLRQARIPSGAADPRPTRQRRQPKKSSFGPWMMNGFRVLAALKGLRGTAFDLFGYTAERRMERALLAAATRPIST